MQLIHRKLVDFFSFARQLSPSIKFPRIFYCIFFCSLFAFLLWQEKFKLSFSLYYDEELFVQNLLLFELYKFVHDSWNIDKWCHDSVYTTLLKFQESGRAHSFSLLKWNMRATKKLERRAKVSLTTTIFWWIFHPFIQLKFQFISQKISFSYRILIQACSVVLNEFCSIQDGSQWYENQFNAVLISRCKLNLQTQKITSITDHLDVFFFRKKDWIIII